MFKSMDIGLLFLRVGTGLMFITHGIYKFMKGEEVLAMIGSALSNIGIASGHAQIGALVASTELLGGVLLVLGLFVRPVSGVLLLIMGGALNFHLSNGDGFHQFGHAIQAGIVFLSLIAAGGGKYSLDERKQGM